MGSGGRLKFAVCEVLQFAAFCVPLFVVAQRFAAIVARVKRSAGDSATTAYWLIVASSVAYVTTVALLVWLPLKYMVFAKKKALVGRKKWRPVALAYVLLSTLPSFAFLIASSEVQIRNDLRLDTFAELPVSLVLFALICIDIVERIRHCRLTGQANVPRDADIATLAPMETPIVTPIITTATGPSPAPSNASAATQNGAGAANGAIPRMPITATVAGLSGNGAVLGLPGNGTVPGMQGVATVMQGVATVPGMHGVATVPGIQGVATLPGMPSNGAVPGLQGNGQGQPYPIGGICPRTGLPLRNYTYAPPYTGPLRFLLASDARAEVFGDSFLFWLDTAEMVQVASHSPVYFSGWALPVYLFSFLSTLRVVLTPHSPLLSPLGVALQDLPFLFLRVALIAIFGFVTPVLFVMKNLLVCLAYIYFNFMTKLKIFNTVRMF